MRLTMGSYGIGVSRLVAVIAEQHHDELGLALAVVGLAVRRPRRDRQQGRAPPAQAPTSWPPSWTGSGVEVLLDDRKASPGVKFKDAELLGVPWIVVVGRGWADGVVELRNRFSGETREIAVDRRGRRDRRRRLAG